MFLLAGKRQVDSRKPQFQLEALIQSLPCEKAVVLITREPQIG